VNMRVNLKEAGDCFGEVSLLYTTPRSATVAATLDSVVWVLERENFRSVTLLGSTVLSCFLPHSLFCDPRIHVVSCHSCTLLQDGQQYRSYRLCLSWRLLRMLHLVCTANVGAVKVAAGQQ
jgi:CRP-like cAMP-binding protein